MDMGNVKSFFLVRQKYFADALFPPPGARSRVYKRSKLLYTLP